MVLALVPAVIKTDVAKENAEIGIKLVDVHKKTDFKNLPALSQCQTLPPTCRSGWSRGGGVTTRSGGNSGNSGCISCFRVIVRTHPSVYEPFDLKLFKLFSFHS